MFEAQNLFYGFLLLFIGVTLCSFGFTALYADRLKLATFIELIIIFIVFLSELAYLVTSKIIWFYRIPEYFLIATFLLIVIALFIAYKKKRKLKQTKAKSKE